MKESPKPPRTFLKCMIGGATAHAYFRGKTLPDAADPVSAVSGIRLPPECRFCWDCKRRKRFNAGVPGAVAPGKIILESPPSRWEGGWGDILPLRGRGAAAKAKGSVGRRQRRQAPLKISSPILHKAAKYAIIHVGTEKTRPPHTADRRQQVRKFGKTDGIGYG